MAKFLLRWVSLASLGILLVLWALRYPAAEAPPPPPLPAATPMTMANPVMNPVRSGEQPAQEKLLTKPPPPSKPARQVLKVAPPPVSLWDRVCAAITVPRTLEWNLGGAMAAACVAVVAMVGVVKMAPERIVDVPVVANPVQTIAVNTDRESKVFVRLVLLQPG
ncbi:hypothetical protein IV102_01945, partial [bacterium]|nr:hypothetical protein [bacterium]